MAKKPISTAPLTFVEIVMRADAETIKAAYEARLKVDALLKEREEAYRRIAELENQVEVIMGEPGVFVFPEPPLPVAGIAKRQPQQQRKRKRRRSPRQHRLRQRQQQRQALRQTRPAPPLLRAKKNHQQLLQIRVNPDHHPVPDTF